MFASGPSVPLIIETPGALPDPLDEPEPDAPAGVPAVVTVQGSVIPEGSSLDNREEGTRGQVVTMYRVFIQGSCPALVPRSRIKWGALTLDVRGDPEFWPDSMGGIDHTEALVALVRG